jgi:hypothetical protein
MKQLSFFIFIVFLPQVSNAIDIEKLFIPDEVIYGHKNYETECKNCHVRGRSTTQKQLCLDCHEKIRYDVNRKSGFHGKNKAVIKTDCKDCHSDHKGRDANIIWLDKDRFDHESTDFSLIGKHRQVECLSCHKNGEKYRKAASECVECHKEDDVHKNTLGDKCENCHNPKGWSSEQFDHDKTNFKLRFAHEKVSCDLCHVGNRYKDTPKKCVSCHAIKDVHQNRFGEQCQDCHNERKWTESSFDHNRDTKYRIEGKHNKVHCHSCHKTAERKSSKGTPKKVNRSCINCHRLDDVHEGKNGKKCDECHNQNGWADSTFDHDKKTEFPLHGAHKKASCQSCHQKDQPGKKTDKACYSCHKHEDAHAGQQGKVCNQCHNDNSWWMEDVRFDHELTDFPLIGQHAVVGCEACHLSSKFKDAKTECINCHQQDDVHNQALGVDCVACHNPNDWLIWQFDHDTTDFKIKGAHKQVHCHSCHDKPLSPDQKIKSRCIDCHHGDDIHHGNFGPFCGKCHSEDDFRNIRIKKH